MYETAVETLIAIANEMARNAKDSMPKLRDGEKIIHERYENGVYFRKTAFAGKTYLAQFDFKTKTVNFGLAS